MKRLLALIALLFFIPLSASAATAIPWAQKNLTDRFITPTSVNGNSLGIILNASSTITGNLTLATTTTGSLNGVIVVASSSSQTISGLTTKLQNAINLCAFMYLSGTCGEVYLPAGVYTFTPNTITLASNVNLVGSGESTKILATTQTAGQAIFIGTNINNFTIKDMFISGVNTSPYGQSTTNNTWGISIIGGTNDNFLNLRFEQFYEDIEVSQVSSSRFDSITDLSGTSVFGSGGETIGSLDVIWAHQLSTSTITNLVAHCGDTCVRLQGGNSVTVSDSNFYNASVEVANGENQGPIQNITISNNHFWENSTNAINLINFLVSPTDVVNVGNGYLAGVNNINIENNTFDMATSTGAAGIAAENDKNYFTTAISNVNIIGNIFSAETATGHSNGDAIRAMDNAGVALRWNISDNQFSSTTRSAINLTSPVNSKIDDNTISSFNRNGNSGQQSAAISIQGTGTTSASNVQVYGNNIDGDFMPNNTALYIGNSSFVTSLELGYNTIINASNTITYANAVPILNTSSFISPVSALYFDAYGGTSTSTFAGHVGINLTNVPYPFMINGGTAQYSLLFAQFSSLELGTTSIPAMQANMTLSAYAKPLPTGANQSFDVMSIAPDNNYGNFISIRWDGANDRFQIISDSSGDVLVQSPSQTATSSIWYQVAYTWDGTTNSIYIDGVLENTSTTAHNTGTTNVLAIGQESFRNYWLGNIANVRIWNTALSSGTISAMYQNGPNAPRSGLVGEWLFAEGSGNMTADTSGQGNIGTITGGNPTWSSDVPIESQTNSIIADMTAPGNATSSLRVYTDGQVDGGWFNSTIATSTLRGVNLPYGGCFAIANNCLAAITSLPVPISQGGTATTTQITNGVNYFDGTRITSNPLFTFNGSTLKVQNNSNSDWLQGFNAGSQIFGIQYKNSAFVEVQSFSGKPLVLNDQGNNVGIASTTPGSLLSIGGSSAGINFSLATSTFSNVQGINLTTGCYAINGTCLTQNAGTVTAVNGTTNQITSSGGTTPTLSLPSLVIFPGNIEAFASSTIGDSTQAGGLTINGGATTTGNAYFASNFGIGSSTPTDPFDLLYGGSFGSFAPRNVVVVASSSGGTATSSLFRIRSDGSTLIGTNSPTFSAGTLGNLGVTGQINANNNIFFPNGQSASEGFFFASVGTFAPGITSNPASNIKFIPGTNAGGGVQSDTYYTSGANWGIGSSSPSARVAISLNNLDVVPGNVAFGIASSTATATSTLFSILNTGHIIASSTNPVLSSCGTSPTMVGDDTHGTITVGSVATGCTMTFQVPYTVAPECIVQNQTGSVTNTFSYTISTTAITVTETALGGDILDYSCEGFLGR